MQRLIAEDAEITEGRREKAESVTISKTFWEMVVYSPNPNAWFQGY
jgi:hypothetical protein